MTKCYIDSQVDTAGRDCFYCTVSLITCIEHFLPEPAISHTCWHNAYAIPVLRLSNGCNIIVYRLPRNNQATYISDGTKAEVVLIERKCETAAFQDLSAKLEAFSNKRVMITIPCYGDNCNTNKELILSGGKSISLPSELCRMHIKGQTKRRFQCTA